MKVRIHGTPYFRKAHTLPNHTAVTQASMDEYQEIACFNLHMTLLASVSLPVRGQR